MTTDQAALDRDRNRCLQVIRAAAGKPVPFKRLCDAAGKPLAPGPAIQILTAVEGIKHRRHKGKIYFYEERQP